MKYNYYHNYKAGYLYRFSKNIFYPFDWSFSHNGGGWLPCSTPYHPIRISEEDAILEMI